MLLLAFILVMTHEKQHFTNLPFF
uniref:Uncharacterized protein n=1 Tax=Arundo donax TaxID=35708 RepID=A0A0A9HT97_ARUDO